VLPQAPLRVPVLYEADVVAPSAIPL